MPQIHHVLMRRYDYLIFVLFIWLFFGLKLARFVLSVLLRCVYYYHFNFVHRQA